MNTDKSISLVEALVKLQKDLQSIIQSLSEEDLIRSSSIKIIDQDLIGARTYETPGIPGNSLADTCMKYGVDLSQYDISSKTRALQYWLEKLPSLSAPGAYLAKIVVDLPIKTVGPCRDVSFPPDPGKVSAVQRVGFTVPDPPAMDFTGVDEAARGFGAYEYKLLSAKVPAAMKFLGSYDEIMASAMKLRAATKYCLDHGILGGDQ